VFKNVMVYRIGPAWSPSLQQIEAGLDQHRFVECGASQEMSLGWSEPRGEAHGPLVEAIGGQWILKLTIESKSVPASVVKRKADERLAEIEATTGRKPGKKETKEIREDVKQSLLPMAFTKRGSVLVWIDPESRTLVVDAGSQGRADEVISGLVKAIDGFSVMQINTQLSPAAAMAEWLTTQEAPAGFSIDRECELKAADESKSVVKYARHALDIEEVRQHVAEGKIPTKLAMTWEGRVSFMLTEGLQVKKVTFLDGVFDEGTSKEKEDGFDADTAISTGEMRQLIPALMLALGGEVEIGVAAPVESAGEDNSVAVRAAAEVSDPADAPF
jgi:recombination associated protein RdgC